ncbi:uncharacterized protein LOC123856829 [Mirounga angustirostris]|uniref:uncharacterized protein LOC123856829 n=1 Tax=Mirounga angustirostris TaxID=9716 RepID=UPI001E6865F3|nr:uncharacterized protein LOC123856829 [Mirounga angustirostris]
MRYVGCAVGCVAAMATGLGQAGGGHLVKIRHVRGFSGAACSLRTRRLPLERESFRRGRDGPQQRGPARGRHEGGLLCRLPPAWGFAVGWRTLLLLPAGAGQSEMCAQKAEGARAGGTVTTHRPGSSVKTPPAGGRRPLAWTCELCFLVERELPVQSVWGRAAHFSPDGKKCQAGLQLSPVGTTCTDVQHRTRVPVAPVPLPASPLLGCLGASGTCSLWGRHRTLQAAQRAHSRDLRWRERDSKLNLSLVLPCEHCDIGESSHSAGPSLVVLGPPFLVHARPSCLWARGLWWPVAPGEGGSCCSSSEAGLGRADDVAAAWPPRTPASQGGCWCLGPRPSWPCARPGGRPRGPP